MDFYLSVTRISGHLVFKMRADIGKRVLEKMNLRNMYRLEGTEITGREFSKRITARVYLF